MVTMRNIIGYGLAMLFTATVSLFVTPGSYAADRAFVDAGKPVIGICNGFQALVKSGILPGPGTRATLTFNQRGHFECRWVTLLPEPDSPCVWTRGLAEPIECPVAHGEGQFVPQDGATLASLHAGRQVALRYGTLEGAPADGAYPSNPNGSIADIAGICNANGNVLGLMPHPEDAVEASQLPRWSRGDRNRLGLPLFVNGIKYASGF